jgi:hypothetical protein
MGFTAATVGIWVSVVGGGGGSDGDGNKRAT